MTPSSRDYWIGRWERGETGWHQAEAEPALRERFKDQPPSRVFVPLCGKSLDLKWLEERGHDVIGVELSELACRAFFQENGLEFRESSRGGFRVFSGGRITLFCGDFFALTPELLGPIGAVYDRAALIALPPELRASYASHLTGLIGDAAKAPSFRFLQILLERTPHDSNGPPFSVTGEELRALYGGKFRIELLSRGRAEPSKPGPFEMHQCVYLLEAIR